MTTVLNLIPRPVSVSESEGSLNITSLSKMLYSGISETGIEILSARFALPGTDKTEEGKFFISLTNDGISLAASEVPDKCDAYVLKVTSDGVRIDARTEAGLFYGIQTFMQLPDECPCVVIEDYAAIPIRMIHWDMKGYLPHFEVLKNEMYRLAAYKINSILFEIEDKYDYRCAPGIAVPGAYTYDEFRELSVLAKSLHIAIVPKLQSIAHVDYILKHEKYSHLREGGSQGQVFQFCPMNHEVEELWNNMCDELMECFAEHGPYFHIGADESGNLGECPECKKLGKAAVYKHRVGRSIDYVCQKGWTPILWDDIVRGGLPKDEIEEARRELGRKAIFMYWEYGYGGNNNVFPFVDTYQAAGIRVWGASGYGGCDNWSGSFPPLSVRHKNCDAWAKEAVEKNIECVCATGWTRIGSADCPDEPQECSWFSIIYAAASMWNTETYELEEFIRILFVQLYGVEVDECLIPVILRNEGSRYDCRRAFETSSPDDSEEIHFLRYSAAAENVRFTITRLEGLMPYYQGKLGNRMESYRLNLLKNLVKRDYEDLIRFRKELYDVMSKYYKEVTVEEFVRTRVDYTLKLCLQFKALIDNTIPY